uniref:Uncharacterized protein n=1 Tax=Arion vulgaris TaxID=1028688 RepID=A0A0B6Y0T9_9EUPU
MKTATLIYICACVLALIVAERHESGQDIPVNNINEAQNDDVDNEAEQQIVNVLLHEIQHLISAVLSPLSENQ